MGDGEFLLKIAKETGKMPSAVRERPSLDLNEAPLWDAYHTLALSRPNNGFGPSAIPLSEIHFYTELAGIPSGEPRMDFLQLIRAMDRHHLKLMEKPNA